MVDDAGGADLVEEHGDRGKGYPGNVEWIFAAEEPVDPVSGHVPFDNCADDDADEDVFSHQPEHLRRFGEENEEFVAGLQGYTVAELLFAVAAEPLIRVVLIVEIPP